MTTPPPPAASSDLFVGADGWLAADAPAARRCPSPNFDARPAGTAIDLLVVHNISLPPGEFGGGHVHRLFTNSLDAGTHAFFAQVAANRVSAHFLIERDGAITQFVSCLDRAWHAGVSRFRGRERCNDYSIGIELEGTDFAPFTDAQYAALGRLVPALTSAFPLAAACGHSDVAVDRKTDPGPLFDWQRCCALARLAAR